MARTLLVLAFNLLDNFAYLSCSPAVPFYFLARLSHPVDEHLCPRSARCYIPGLLKRCQTIKSRLKHCRRPTTAVAFLAGQPFDMHRFMFWTRHVENDLRVGPSFFTSNLMLSVLLQQLCQTLPF